MTIRLLNNCGRQLFALETKGPAAIGKVLVPGNVKVLAFETIYFF